ncbi:HNH endonuclease [Rufibacter ruber]|uniref:HNH endonuclease n=1 Tax=Rufibacter ruber TaxID=1783499 RepID=UPI0008352DDB
MTYFKIHERDGFKCIYCGKSSIIDGVKLRVDHIYPRSKGGDNDPKNLVTSCEPCNLHKTDMILSDDIILELWKRNDKLNKRFTTSEYTTLVTEFNKIYKRL